MKNKRICEQGITLIALIITIIVMLILVGVTINILANSGLINAAKEASFKSDLAIVKEHFDVNKINFKDVSATTEEELLKYIPEIKDKTINGKKYADIIQIYKGTLCQKDEIDSEQIREWLSTIGINEVVIENIADNTKWRISKHEDNATCEITGYIGENDSAINDLIIPNIYIDEEGKKYKITCIHGWNGEQIRFKLSNLENIEISKGITILEGYSFFDLRNLKKVIIPEEVNHIGYYCFSYCTSLETIELPNNLKSIVAFAFYNCTALKEINIPEGTYTIEAKAFYGCKNLKNVTLPTTLTYLGASAFAYDSALESITVHGNVGEFVDGYVFQECTSLNNVTLEEGIKTISTKMFYNCSSLQNISIPSTTTKISAEAFGGCTSLNQIYINMTAEEANSKITFEENWNPLNVTVKYKE